MADISGSSTHGYVHPHELFFGACELCDYTSRDYDDPNTAECDIELHLQEEHGVGEPEVQNNA